MYLRSLRTLSVTLPPGSHYLFIRSDPVSPRTFTAFKCMAKNGLFIVIYTRVLDARTPIKNKQFATRFFPCGLIHRRPNVCTSLVLFKRNPCKARVTHGTSSFSLTSCRCAYVTASHNRCYVSRVHTITLLVVINVYAFSAGKHHVGRCFPPANVYVAARGVTIHISLSYSS